jgi:hypothetical protein
MTQMQRRRRACFGTNLDEKWIGRTRRKLGEALGVSAASRVVPILDEDVSKLLHRAVVAGKEDEAPFLLSAETVRWVEFVRGLGCSWSPAGPTTWAVIGLHGQVRQVSFPSLSYFKFLFSVFILCLIFLFEFRSDFYFVLQVQNYLNINIIL